MVSGDGRESTQMHHGDILVIEKSRYPVPAYKTMPFQREWFKNLVEKFNWNMREMQRPHGGSEEGDKENSKKDTFGHFEL